jgi:hypothetical protein
MGRKAIATNQKLIQLQVSEEDYADLEAASLERRQTEAWWSVPEEVRYRIAVSKYGLPAAIADLAREITIQAEKVAPIVLGSPVKREDMLAILRDALMFTMIGLGAGGSSAAGQLGSVIAAGVVERVKEPERLMIRDPLLRGNDLSGGIAYRTLARVAKELGFHPAEAPANKE